MAKLTLLAEEAASHQLWEVEARRDAKEAEKAFEELSTRAWQDEEEAAKVRRERDELLQRDTESR